MLDCIVDWMCRTLPDRGIYKNGKEAFLALVGYSIGLGNMWRFPYQSYYYGGATYLIAYGVCMMCVGLPLHLMELSLGQYLGLGPTHLFAYMCPLLSGVGWGMILLMLMMCVYYNVLLGWSLFYLRASFSTTVPWSHCLDVKHELDCDRDSMNQSYESAKHYFNHVVIGLPNKDESPYEMLPSLVVCLAVAWGLVGVFLVQGIRHNGKLFYVTVIYPYVVLLCLFGMNYDHIKGDTWVQSITHVDFQRLLQPEIWSAAATQMVFSIGIGHGTIMVASHNRLTHNVVRDSFLLCLLDLVTSVFCSNVMFSLAASISPNTAENSHGLSPLIFILSSAMISRINSSLWSFLFYSMIFALGFDSLLLMVAAVTTTLFDQFPQLRTFHPFVIACTCCLFFLFGLPMCIRNGIFIFNVLNEYTAKHTIILSLLEVLITSYFFGYRRILKLMKENLQVWVPPPLRWYLTITWSLITPCSLLVLCGIMLYEEDWAGYAGQELSFISGQVISFAPLVLVPIFAIYVCCTKGKKTLKDLVSSTPEFHTAKFREGDMEPIRVDGVVPMPMHMFGHRIEQDNYI